MNKVRLVGSRTERIGMKYSIFVLTLMVLVGCSSLTPGVDVVLSPTGAIYTNVGADVDVDVVGKSNALQRCKELGYDDVATFRDVKRNCHVGIATGVICRVQRVVIDHECVGKEEMDSRATGEEIVMTVTMDRPIPLAVFTEIDVMARLQKDHQDVVKAVLENQAVHNAALASCRMHNENVNLVTPLTTEVECLEISDRVCLQYEFQRRFRCSDSMSEFFNR